MKNKTNISRSIGIGIGTVVLATVGYMIFMYEWNGRRFDREAMANKKYLNSLVIVSGIETNASAEPNGDRLTANSGPAYADFTVDEPLKDIYADVAKNLKDQGYTIDKQIDTFSQSSDKAEAVTIKATKDTKSMRLRFEFQDTIMCSVKISENREPCYYSRPVTIEDSGLLNKNISMLKIFYDNN